jgi:hypothetical protein
LEFSYPRPGQVSFPHQNVCVSKRKAGHLSRERRDQQPGRSAVPDRVLRRPPQASRP